MGRVYAVVSAKGGVGKTTTTTNLAAALAAAGADVAVADGDLGMANLAGALGVVPTGPTLHDVLAGETTVSEATQEGPHGMAVVPGATDLDAFARADPEGLRDVLSELADRHEYVLLDTGAGLSNDTVVPLTYVDEALLVSTTGRDALGDTEKTRQVAVRLDVPVAGAVLTRVDPEDPTAVTAEGQLDAETLQAIPDENVVRRAGDAGEPLTTFAPESRAAAAYRALAADLTGESVPQPDSVAAPDGPNAEGGGDAADGGSGDGDATAGENESDATTERFDGAETEADATGQADADVERGTAEGDADAEADSEGDVDAEADPEGDAPDSAAADAAEPLVEDAEPHTESAGPSTDPSAGAEEVSSEADSEANSKADEPLVEAAEPDAVEETSERGRPRSDDSDREVQQIPFAGGGDDGDEDADADVNEEAEEGGEGEEDEDDGVYKTELGESADGAEKRDDDEGKKGLFGRFLR